MSNSKENKEKKEHCKQMYLELEKSIDEIVSLTGIKKRTIETWIRKDKWNDAKNESRQIEKQIDINARKALAKGLKAYATNPENKDLQSLVSLLKSFREGNKPTQTYKENIIKFLDQTTDFFLEKEMTETAQIFKEIITPLAEYLLKRS